MFWKIIIILQQIVLETKKKKRKEKKKKMTLTFYYAQAVELLIKTILFARFDHISEKVLGLLKF